MAGTDKLYVIKAICNHMFEIAQKYGINSKEEPLLLVFALTGISAFNINGHTIHFALMLSINSNNLKLSSKSLKKLQQLFKNVKVILFDKKSMISYKLLVTIDQYLYQIFSQNKDMLFDPRLHDFISESGHKIYTQFNKTFKLETIQRQAGDLKEQQAFRSLLLYLQDGKSTKDNWQLYNNRVRTFISSTEKAKFKDAIRLFTIWDHVDEYNILKLKQLNLSIAKIKAVYSGTGAKNAPSDTTNSLDPILFLSIGAHVMLISNLWTNQGLVNRTMGMVVDILYELGRTPPLLPTVILAKMNNYMGSMISILNYHKVVPIWLIKYTWKGKSENCFRMQFSLCLAWAITIHKSQGLTLQHAIINLGNKEFATGLTFVGISRVHALTDLLFKFNFL
ncbi:16356_t:CDS:2 [Cetraspora pellucida]|uniref:ATP-dependent DNA helicase n=1 Tax=Cetraspora pellucida TaxID=1433469 RepID=A0A9N9EAN7_9GLOM|nr:16356_t:CDS:2 [Cetraspora pellucida]